MRWFVFLFFFYVLLRGDWLVGWLVDFWVLVCFFGVGGAFLVFRVLFFGLIFRVVGLSFLFIFIFFFPPLNLMIIGF